MRIFVASLPFNVLEWDLISAFSEFGVVDSVEIISEGNLGRSKCHCFIEMPNVGQARKAIARLDGAQFSGRTIVVDSDNRLDR